MKYDFDRVIDRGIKSGSYSLKWEVEDNELPMWVADMDFATAPEIVAAIQERAMHPVFGYSVVPQEWYAAYRDWWKNRHHFLIEKEWLMFCTGVVPAISSVVRRMTLPAENVAVLTPAYNIFFNSIVNNGRNVLECPLGYEAGQYFVDFSALEEKLRNPQTSLLILCNPHNPVGKIWSRDELDKIGQLCRKHHVTVLSDEIHCDITAPGCAYTPFASVSETNAAISITCVAPTKTFNLAGLQSAAIFVPEENLRHRVNRGINTDEVAEPNSFAITAAVAAFTHGAAWLEELRQYIQENRQTVEAFVKEKFGKPHTPHIGLVRSEATYLLWLDCSAVTGNTEELAAYIRSRTGLYVSAGIHYRGNGSNFLRLNIACPRSVLKDGLNRLETGICSYVAETSQ